jgi:hypothetical protein
MMWNANLSWVPGAMLLTFGLLIALFPELLSLLVASALMMIGLTWIFAAWQTRQMRKRRPQVVWYERRDVWN